MDPRRYPDPDRRAAIAIEFMQQFDIWEGDWAGDPINIAPFQAALLRAIYGLSDAKGDRLCREAYVWMPRGNGKTALVSLLTLLHLVMPGYADPGALVVLAAADREQAGIAYKHVVEMARSHPGVESMLKINESQKRIKVRDNPNELKVVSSEAYTKHGMAPSFFLADEIHAWEPGRAHDLFDIVSKGMAKRRNPLTVSLSTAGQGQGTLAADKWHLCESVQGQGKQASGKIVPFFIGATKAEIKRGWRNRALRRKVNPAIAAGFLHEAELDKELEETRLFPRAERDYRQYRLNEWQDAVANPWITEALYDTQTRQTGAIKPGAACSMGIDIGRMADLYSVVTDFPAPDGGHEVLAKHWTVRKDIALRAERDGADYLRWVKDGWMAYGGDDFIEDDGPLEYIKGIHDRYDLRRVSADPFQAQEVLAALNGMGMEAFAQRQNMTTSAAPMNDLEKLIKARKFRHGGDPVLRHCFLNAVVVRDRLDNPQLHKGKSTGRVDGVAASWMALAYWGTEEARLSGSPWDDPEFSLADLIA